MAYPRRGWCRALAACESARWNAVAAGWIQYPAGVRGAVFMTTNRGTTWDSLPSSPPDTITGIAAAFHLGVDIFCSTTGGLYKSADTGRTWNKILAVPGLRAIDLLVSQLAVAGDSGIWFSGDYGNTWARFDTGLAVRKVNALRFVGGSSPAWLMLLAGTQGGGVYYYDFGPTAVGGHESEPPRTAAWTTLCRNRLALTLDRPGKVALRDVTGRTRLTQALPAGKAELDVSALPSGVYQLVGSRPFGRVIINR